MQDCYALQLHRDVSVAEVLDQADADQGHNEQAGEHRDECGVAVGLIRRVGNYERGQLVAGQTGERPGAQRQTVRGGDGFGAEVLIKHIGGYPGKYDPSVIGSLMARPPKLFISGHSHILKVKYDKTLDMLHINPGAAGMSGFHKVRTMVRFVIDNGTFKDLEVIELAG